MLKVALIFLPHLHCYTQKAAANTSNAQLNPICHLLALLAHLIFHVSRIRVKGEVLLLNIFRGYMIKCRTHQTGVSQRFSSVTYYKIRDGSSKIFTTHSLFVTHSVTKHQAV
jgi:hypothetical protein